jgi:hypothetical protein
MTINDFYADVEKPRGGRWVNLNNKGERLDGILRDIEVRPRTDPEGNVVLGRKSGNPRKVYHIVVEVPEDQREGRDDDGLRNWDANEAGQEAVRIAYKAAGTKDLLGGRFAVVVTADPPDKWSQAEYKAKFEPPAPKTTVDLPDDDNELF